MTVMQSPGLTHYVEFLMHGLVAPEVDCREIGTADPLAAAAMAPPGAYAFRFYDVMFMDHEGTLLTSHRLHETGLFYIDARCLSFEEVEFSQMEGRDELLLTMSANSTRYLVHCRTGGYLPLRSGDQIINLTMLRQQVTAPVPQPLEPLPRVALPPLKEDHAIPAGDEPDRRDEDAAVCSDAAPVDG